MGRGRKTSRRRDTSAIANASLPTASTRPYKTPSLSITTRSLLREIEDRREWHPEGPKRPAKGFRSSRHRLAQNTQTPRPDPYKPFKAVPTGTHSPLTRIGFEDPTQIAICVRRKQREEVLHAKKKTGRSGQKRPKRSYYSSISCKGKK